MQEAQKNDPAMVLLEASKRYLKLVEKSEDKSEAPAPTPKITRASLLRLISDYGSARIGESWRGGMDPKDMPEAEARLKKAVKAIDDAMDILFPKPEK